MFGQPVKMTLIPRKSACPDSGMITGHPAHTNFKSEERKADSMKKTCLVILALYVSVIGIGCSSSSIIDTSPSTQPTVGYNQPGSMQQYEDKRDNFRGRTAGGEEANDRSLRFTN